MVRRAGERRRSGACSPEVEAKLAERLPDEAEFGALPPLAELDYAARRAMASWEVTAAYPIDTEKGGLARHAVMFVKRLARLWARIAVGPIQNNQIAFNRDAASAVEAVRRHAVLARAEELAAEKDLAELAGAMVQESESAAIASEVKSFFGGAPGLVVVGPCPTPLMKALKSGGTEVLAVSAGTAWDARERPLEWGAAPLSFLRQLEEGSRHAILFSELSFWLRPEALLALARRSYLALAPGGKVAISVHGFASGSPAPAWVSSQVVKKALSIAGFTNISVSRPPEEAGGYLATARKP